MSNRPKPTETKLAEGNRGHRPIENDDFQPERIMPEMPKGLSRAGKREWSFISRVLFDKGVLTEVDRQALAGYCEAFGQAEEALRGIKKYGQVIGIPLLVRETGEPVLDRAGFPIVSKLEKNPSVGIYIEMAKLMKSFLIEFGLTPASRSKIKLPAKTKEDEFDKVMGKRPRVGFQPTPSQPTEPVNRA